MVKNSLYILLCVLFVHCDSYQKKTASVDTYSAEGNLQAVIEIPAGTTLKIEYNKKTHTFEPDQRNGKDRVIQYLPYVGNYGFIPDTFLDPKEGGDSDPLDVLVLSSALSTGTVIEIEPIALLQLVDNGENDAKVLAVPVDPNQRVINATSLSQMRTIYPEVLDIIETWFLKYDTQDETLSLGWKDELIAQKMIQTSLVKE